MTFGGTGSQRAGRWAGRHAREQQWEYVVRIWRPLLVFELVVFLGAFGMMAAFQTMAMSFAAGIIVSVGVLVPAFVVAQQTGTVPTMAGAEAERWTSDDLKRLRRRGWLTVDHVPFHNGDIDHAVLTQGTVRSEDHPNRRVYLGLAAPGWVMSIGTTTRL